MLSQEKSVKKSRILSSSEEESAAALRAELELELQNKKQCAYGSYECTQLTLNGYKYCSKHILNDKNAPFKQCTFTYQNNGRRCHLPAPKGEKKDYGYCNEHALKSTLARNRQNSKYPPPHTAEFLLHSLSHYVKKPRNRTLSSSSYISDEGGRNTPDDGSELKVTKSLDPFCDLDANAVFNGQCNEVLELCSESESDVEPSTFSSVWHDAQADSSDNESIDSEQEDILKHANVYTAEEITVVTRDKLIRLQSLYIEQYRHLQHMLRERRRKYIHSLKREKETCCNIYHQVRDNPKEQRLYKKLKNYNKYHKTFGEEAILSKKFHDLRSKISDGVTHKNTNFSKCSFTEGGVKCGEKVLPMAKHCRKHILEDTNQVLFKACGKVNGDVECNTPVEAIFDDSTCRLHMEIPPIRSYNQPRKESESDGDDTLDIPSHFTLQATDNVKTELIDYSIPPELPKMESLPSILFEESSESMPANHSNMDFSSNFDSSLNMQPSQLKVEDDDNAVSDLNIKSEVFSETEFPENSQNDVNMQIEEKVVQEDTENSDPLENNDSPEDLMTSSTEQISDAKENVPEIAPPEITPMEHKSEEQIVEN